MKKTKNSIPFEWEKRNWGKVVTRDGRSVKYLRLNHRNNVYPIIGVVADDTNEWEEWTLTGHYYSAPTMPKHLDLFIIVSWHVRLWNHLITLFK